LREAKEFLAIHRHHKTAAGHRFTIGAEKDGKLVGVAICGRPTARMTDQRNILEVTRCCTDGTKNACSFLYAAAVRVAGILGFKKVQTFILSTEPGTSLRAAGFEIDGTSEGGPWDRSSRARKRRETTEGSKVKYCRIIKQEPSK
jgi:hypothetical protein